MPRLLSVLWLSLLGISCAPAQPERPNILLILADDLGLAELGCTGASIIRTPHLDHLRDQGMLFTQAYSGSAVCAPTRCTLLTGKHTGHAQVRGNRAEKNWSHPPGAPGVERLPAWEEPPPSGLWGGQYPLAEGTETLATALARANYATACIGKWGLGGPGTSGTPKRQGFDFFYGYNCQRHAHNYYPRYLDKNGAREDLVGNERKPTGAIYAPDRMLEEALDFLRDHTEDPFFLYYSTPVPHLALQVPDDSLAEYEGLFSETPYPGGKGYLPHEKPRAAYAAMVSRLDRDVGRLLAELELLELEKNTIVIFLSDNGSTFQIGGYDPDFFQGTGGKRGAKTQLYEGGIRVPCIVRWPDRIPANAVSQVPMATWDLMPTLLSLAQVSTTAQMDGLDFSPVLLRTGPAPSRPFLYWEYPEGPGWRAILAGRWKGVIRGTQKKMDPPFQLFDLQTDPAETTDLVAKHPQTAARLRAWMDQSHERSPVPAWQFLIESS